MKISKFTVNPFAENTYILWHEDTGDAAVVDPGMCTAEECVALKRFFEGNRLNPKAVFLTHQHVDHIMGTGFLVNEYGCDVYGHSADILLGQKADVQVRMFGLPYKVMPFALTHLVKDGDTVSLCNENITVLHTPGHSAGGVVYYLPETCCAFVGDTIFQMSIGRTDLIGGDYETLMKSIKTKVLTLPEETVLYSGHGDSTTVGDELQYNPYVKK